MKVRIKRVEDTLPLPEYQTSGSVAFDIYSRTDLQIPGHETKIAPSNLIIEVPEGYFLMICARSSLQKKGLMLANGIGIIDQDYHGPEDEIGILLYNSTHDSVKIEKMDRIAQGLILPIIKAEWEEAADMKAASRGGFGSTGIS